MSSQHQASGGLWVSTTQTIRRLDQWSPQQRVLMVLLFAQVSHENSGQVLTQVGSCSSTRSPSDWATYVPAGAEGCYHASPQFQWTTAELPEMLSLELAPQDNLMAVHGPQTTGGRAILPVSFNLEQEALRINSPGSGWTDIKVFNSFSDFGHSKPFHTGLCRFSKLELCCIAPQRVSALPVTGQRGKERFEWSLCDSEQQLCPQGWRETHTVSHTVTRFHFTQTIEKNLKDTYYF